MKSILPVLMLGFAFSAIAGEKNDNYNFSVFHNAAAQIAQKETKAATTEVLQSKFPGCYFHIDKLSGSVNDIYGKSIEVPGSTVLEKTQYCISDMLADLDIKAKEWQLARNIGAPHADHVDYHQYIRGHKVLFSRLGFRFSKSGNLVRTIIRTYGRPSANTIPILSKDDALDLRVMTEGINGLNIISKEVNPDWVWFPVPAGKSYALQPAWKIDIKATVGVIHPVTLRCYIDATDGKLLYRTNEVKDAFDVTVNGSVYVQAPLSPATLQPLNNMLVIINGSSYYTDGSGKLSLPSLTNVTGNYVLAGKWVNVIDKNTNSTPGITQFLSGTGNNYTFPGTVPQSNSRLVNAYYHTDKIHDYMKQYLPAFTDLDLPVQANVDLTSGSCNAFYIGGSINFYAENGTCNSFAEVGDIVYHEYGHAINDVFYSSLLISGMENGALNEGYADVWAVSLNKDGVMGEGAYKVSGGGYTRRYDKLPKIYPTDIVGEVHADGEIIAGAWWDVAENINSIDTMTMLFAAGYYDLPDGPNGSEGQVYHDVLVSAILNDDNDGNLSNGTPHFAAIAKAFARHGIYLYGDATFVHNEVSHKAANTLISLTAYLSVTDMAQLTGLKLMYKDRAVGSWKSVNMTLGSGSNFTGQIPKQEPGTIIDYYFQALTTASMPHGIFPLNFDPALPGTVITLPYQFGVGVVTKDSNHFETAATGWTVGNVAGDDATTGLWVYDKPVGSYTQSGSVSQPGFDHTTGNGKCLITGNAPGAASDIGVEDVDNGITTVLSPVFNISSFQKPVIEYYRWFGNSRGGNAGNDAWHVQISDTNGVWYTVDSTYQPDYQWRRRIFAVDDYITAAKTVQIRFTASDIITNDAQNQGQSVVEAGIDDLFIYDKAPVGIDASPEMLKAEVYPNPADNMINVKLPIGIDGVAILYNINGQTVQQIELDNSKTNYAIDTKQLAQGQYTLVISSGKSVQSTRLVIQHK